MAAIIANPDEDTPRLALADWLQEHGDKHDQARAEFIRLQIRAAALTDAKARRAVEASANNLERKHRTAWLKPLSAIDDQMDTAGAYGPFTRGLLTRAIYTTSEFLHKKQHPLLPGALAAVGVEALILFGTSKRIADLAASEAVRSVSTLAYAGADDRALALFGKSPHFAHLSSILLDEVTVTDSGLRAFAETTDLARLRAFGLSVNRPRQRYTASGLLAVLKSARLPLLDTLSLFGGQPERFGYQQLLADPLLSRLTTFHLGFGAPLSPVVACPHLTNLRELTGSHITITDVHTETLLGNRAFGKLTTLSLDHLNPNGRRLSAAVARKLRARFGKGLTLKYATSRR
jgi:uncharacterized protein (TIGR02996 family)